MTTIQESWIACCREPQSNQQRHSKRSVLAHENAGGLSGVDRRQLLFLIDQIDFDFCFLQWAEEHEKSVNQDGTHESLKLCLEPNAADRGLWCSHPYKGLWVVNFNRYLWNCEDIETEAEKVGDLKQRAIRETGAYCHETDYHQIAMSVNTQSSQWTRFHFSFGSFAWNGGQYHDLNIHEEYDQHS